MVVSKFCQIAKFRCCQSGKILPNLVSLHLRFIYINTWQEQLICVIFIVVLNVKSQLKTLVKYELQSTLCARGKNTLLCHKAHGNYV